ncbi:MAG: RHS repeat protein [Treponema sp.]|nr:RHS repeat protein [Treponema sp.]
MKQQDNPVVQKAFSVNGRTMEKRVVFIGIEDEYDENGNLIYHRYAPGNENLIGASFETQYEYNENGKPVHIVYKDNENDEDEDMREEWYEYDEKGNCIHKKDNYWHEVWYEFDENGNEIYSKNYNGIETKNEFDENGRRVHSTGSDGEKWYEYDEKGNLILIKDESGEIIDENVYEYDENENLVYKEVGDWKEWYEYDGNKITSRRRKSIIGGIECSEEYDEDGFLIHRKCREGLEEKDFWYKYKLWEDGTIKQRIRYMAVGEN